MDDETSVVCPNCGSSDIRATGSEQERKGGKHYADMICNQCEKSFWSSHSDAIAASRKVDRERRENAERQERERNRRDV